MSQCWSVFRKVWFKSEKMWNFLEDHVYYLISSWSWPCYNSIYQKNKAIHFNFYLFLPGLLGVSTYSAGRVCYQGNDVEILTTKTQIYYDDFRFIWKTWLGWPQALRQHASDVKELKMYPWLLLNYEKKNRVDCLDELIAGVNASLIGYSEVRKKNKDNSEKCIHIFPY